MLIDISPSQIISTNLQSFAASSNPAAATIQVGDAVFPADAALTPDQFNTALAQVTAANNAIMPDAINIRANPDVGDNLLRQAYETAASIFTVFSRLTQDVIAVVNSLVPDVSEALK